MMDAHLDLVITGIPDEMNSTTIAGEFGIGVSKNEFICGLGTIARSSTIGRRKNKETASFSKSLSDDGEDHLAHIHCSFEDQCMFRPLLLAIGRPLFDLLDFKIIRKNVVLYIGCVYITGDCD